MLSALAPGQSEHPQHAHFADGLDAFRDVAGRQSGSEFASLRLTGAVDRGSGADAAQPASALRLVLQPVETP